MVDITRTETKCSDHYPEQEHRAPRYRIHVLEELPDGSVKDYIPLTRLDSCPVAVKQNGLETLKRTAETKGERIGPAKKRAKKKTTGAAGRRTKKARGKAVESGPPKLVAVRDDDGRKCPVEGCDYVVATTNPSAVTRVMGAHKSRNHKIPGASPESIRRREVNARRNTRRAG